MENNHLLAPFLKAQNCARREDGRECFTLYFHSCLISFLNSMRVEHRNFTMGGLGAVLLWFGDKAIFPGDPLPSGGGGVLRDEPVDASASLVGK